MEELVAVSLTKRMVKASFMLRIGGKAQRLMIVPESLAQRSQRIRLLRDLLAFGVQLLRTLLTSACHF